MFHILWVAEIQSSKECLTFQDTNKQIKNNCSFSDDAWNQTYNDLCLTCTILNTDQVPENNCRNSFTCIEFFFDHNSIYESFFQKYRYIIEELYTNDTNLVLNSRLIIHIKRYNLTDINFAYLNSILNINSQHYNELRIEFNHFTRERKPITVAGNFSDMIISTVILSIPCNIYDEMVNYRIRLGKIVLTNSNGCQASQSKKSVNSKSADIPNANRKTYSLINSRISRITTLSKSKIKILTSSRYKILLSTKIKGSQNNTSTSTTILLTTKFSSTTSAAISRSATTTKPTTSISSVSSTTITSTTSTRLLVSFIRTSAATTTSIITPIIITDATTTIEITATSAVKTSVSQRSKQYTTTNLITSSLSTPPSSQSGSSLLYLLSVFFIIMICLIIASIWGFFRRNNHHQYDTGDQRSNTMYNMIHSDKYSVSDKDSKSAASWSHGSTLLLSPLVK